MELDTLDIDDVDKEILRLKYIHRKISFEKIGLLLATPITGQSVHQRMNKPEVKKVWDQLERDVIWHLKQAQLKAFQVLYNALDSNDERIRVSAAKTFLDPVFEHCSQLIPQDLETKLLDWDISTTEDQPIDVEVVKE